MSVPALYVVDYRVWGHFDMELANHMLEHVEQQLDRVGGQFAAFHDWSEMTSYETRARLRLTAWVLKHRARFDGIYILSSQALVSMGVTVANLTLGQFMTSYGARDRLEYIAVQREVIQRLGGPGSSRFPPPRSIPPPRASVPPPSRTSIPPPPSRR